MYTNKAKRLVLGEGETIGHKHVLECNEAFAYDRAGESIRLMLSGMGILTHDEHDRVVLDKGKYRSYHQMERNPMDGTNNRVFD